MTSEQYLQALADAKQKLKHLQTQGLRDMLAANGIHENYAEIEKDEDVSDYSDTLSILLKEGEFQMRFAALKLSREQLECRKNQRVTRDDAAVVFFKYRAGEKFSLLEKEIKEIKKLLNL